MSNIIVLDGYTLNPGDLSWDSLEALGSVTVYPRTPASDVVARAAGAEVALVNKVRMTRAVIEQLPDLAYIGIMATGYDTVDTAAAAERGIPVTNVPSYGTDSVAQMTFAHLLNLTQHVAHHADTTRQGRWSEAPDFCYWDYPMVELNGRTMGIVGLGRIGSATGRLALAFGMRVLAYDPFLSASPVDGVELTDLERILTESDVVSLHVPLTPETRGLINAATLAKMKETAFLINTSRGPVVEAEPLADALNNGRLAGAGLDVLPTEPPPPDSALLHAQNCFVTPHISWATRSARARLMAVACQNVAAFLAGEPQNVVNLQS